MNSEMALVPQMLASRGNKILENVLAIAIGVSVLSLLAQIAIPLPWTPVPITGQTFGVALTALLWGGKRSFAIMCCYLLLGAVGLPVFALGRAGISFGPTFGYLIGMLISSYVMGFLSDHILQKTFLKIYAVSFLGSVITFTCGLIGLSYFIPSQTLLSAGLLPFLPGDIVKTLLASLIVVQSQKIIL